MAGFCALGEVDVEVAVAAVGDSDVFSVEIDEAEIVDFVGVEDGGGAGGEGGAVEDAAVALVVLLHRCGAWCLRWGWGGCEKSGAHSVALVGGKVMTGFVRGASGSGFAGQKIFGHQVARLVELWSCPAGFGDGGVVVVAGGVGFEGAVGAGPEAEG